MGRALPVVWLAVAACCWPTGRNPAGGNPDQETLLTTCATGGWQVRLYEGDGGATTAYWSTVTVERPGRPERQVFFAYADPLVDALVCDDAGVELRAGGALVRELAVGELEALRSQPISLWRGAPQ